MRRAVRAAWWLAVAGVLLCACSADTDTDDSDTQARGAEPFDIAINGGRVLDPETGLDAIRSVGIRDGAIVAVEMDELRGTRTIDATGLVVTPGFIDLHSHGQSPESDVYKIRDGVTTALDLELGRPNLAAWLAQRQRTAVLNFGASASHQFARAGGTAGAFNNAAVYAKLDADGIDVLTGVLADELAAGGIGIGLGIGYVPGAARDELLAVFETASAHAVPVFVHVRNPDLASIEEAIDLARATGASVHIMHINSMALARIDAALEAVATARAEGVDVTTELYPYTAGSTLIESALFDAGWQERFGATYSDLQWPATGERLTEETFAQYRQAGGVVIIHMMQEAWIEQALRSGLTIIASDGMPYAPGAHPRSAGTFSRVLGHYVRERNVLTLPEAIRKMTLMPAQRIEAVVPAARRKGRIQPDMDADITVFDPERIQDRATFDQGLAYSEGIEFVIVSGTLVVDNGATVTGIYPGRALTPGTGR